MWGWLVHLILNNVDDVEHKITPYCEKHVCTTHQHCELWLDYQTLLFLCTLEIMCRQHLTQPREIFSRTHTHAHTPRSLQHHCLSATTTNHLFALSVRRCTTTTSVLYNKLYRSQQTHNLTFCELWGVLTQACHLSASTSSIHLMDNLKVSDQYVLQKLQGASPFQNLSG